MLGDIPERLSCKKLQIGYFHKHADLIQYIVKGAVYTLLYHPYDIQESPFKDLMQKMVSGKIQILMKKALIIIPICMFIISFVVGGRARHSHPAAPAPGIPVHTSDHSDNWEITPAPVPTPTPTPEPTPEPTPTPLIYGQITPGPLVPMEYFDDVLFVGDSNTHAFRRYVEGQRAKHAGFLGGAGFLAAGSFGLYHALNAMERDAVRPAFNRQEWLVEDFIAQHPYTKIYILLGTNDIGAYGVDRSVENYIELIRRIRLQSPKVTIFIQSVPPMTQSSQMRSLNNANIHLFNEKMLAWSKENECYFLNIASVMQDEEGHLPMAYSRDSYVHLSAQVFSIWAEYLRRHIPPEAREAWAVSDSEEMDSEGADPQEGMQRP